MARQFKLGVLRKNCSRKRKSLRVRISRSKIDVFSVAIPLDCVKLARTFNVTSLEQLQSALGGLIPGSWALVDSDPSKLVLASVITQPSGSSMPPVTTATLSFCVTILEDLSWTLTYLNKTIAQAPLSSLRTHLTSASSVLSILHFLDNDAPSLICAGNDDERFQSLPRTTKGVFLDIKGKLVTFISPMPGLLMQSSLVGNTTAHVEHGTVRHVNCELLLDNKTTKRCKVCISYRKVLRAIASRRARSDLPTAATNQCSQMNNRWRTCSELSNKMSHLVAEVRLNKARVQTLTAKLEEASHQDGIAVDSSTHSDLVTIMSENTANVASSYPENSLPRLFWDQQLKATQHKNGKSMRWHPMMVKWCLYLQHLAGKGYEMLRQSGCLSLPSPRTLRDYTYYNSTTIGFSAATDEELLNVFKANGWSEEWQKVVVVLMDEVYIREEVVFHKHTGQILGLVNLGDINNHLLR